MGHILYENHGDHPFKIYMAVSSNIIRVIEYASRLCYDSADKMSDDSWEKYIGARVSSGHESVIEHGLISFIIDLTEYGDVKNEVHDLEEMIAESNTLLHYVKETGWNHAVPDNPIIILSGNLKMWRDFIKWTCNNYHTSSVVSRVIDLFVHFDYHSCKGIFTKDIPMVRQSNFIIKRGLNFSPIESIRGRLVEDWSSKALLDPSLFRRIYTQRNETEEDDGTIDFGVDYRLVSIDNFGSEFMMYSDESYPGYMKCFVQRHVNDLNSISFLVSTPRVISQQECRHRINSISQRSQRYVNEYSKSNGFYVPDTIDEDEVLTIKHPQTGNDLQLSYMDLCDVIMQMYHLYNEKGVKNEDCRFILPNCIYTKMMITKPLYTMHHYFKERCSPHAQKEMREPAIALRDCLNETYRYTVPDNGDLFPA